jgi:peptidoglycan/LPS O-acetylase OafA/YrhL
MKYRPEIDGLRSLAVIPVILFHAGFSFFKGGFVGVDIFFVISGYLITLIIISELGNGKFSIINFYERRARRILPALFVVIAVSSLAAWIWFIPSDMKAFSKSIVAVLTFSSNFLFYKETGYFDTSTELKPMLHTWSLAVEEQYYIFFPLILCYLWKLGKSKLTWILLGTLIISLMFAQWASKTHPEFAFFLLPSRSWELLIGALAAFYIHQLHLKPSFKYSNHLSLLGLLCILFSIFSFDKYIPFPSVYALLPTVGAALIILYANQGNFVGRLLSSKPLVGIGLISYSAYLWHQPILAFARYRCFSSINSYWMVLLILLTLVLAYISWKYVETPFRNKETINRRKIFILSISISLFFIVIGITGYLTNGFENRVNHTVIELDKATFDINPYRNTCLSGEKFIHPKSACVIGAKNNVIGALVGDSHADAIRQALNIQADKSNLGFKELTYGGCIHALDTYHSKRPNDKCNEYNKAANEFVLANPEIKTVVIMSRWTLPISRSRFDNHEGGKESGEPSDVDVLVNGKSVDHIGVSTSELIAQKIKVTVESYLDRNKKVILIYPIPEVGWDVPNYLAKSTLFSGSVRTDLSTSYALYKARNKKAIDALDAIGNHENLTRIYPDRILCNTFQKERCVAQLNGVPLYYDNNHLSNFGAAFIVSEIIKNIN